MKFAYPTASHPMSKNATYNEIGEIRVRFGQLHLKVNVLPFHVILYDGLLQAKNLAFHSISAERKVA